MRLYGIAFVLACACGSSPPPQPPVAPVASRPDATPARPDEAAAAPAPPPPAPPQPAQPDPAQVREDLLAAETAAYAQAKPVFEKYCAGCHTRGARKASRGKLEHFDMTSYPFGGHHATEIGAEIREVLGLTGKKPTMPANDKGAVRGAELELIATWANAFDAAQAAGAHEASDAQDHGHHHK